MKLRPLGLALTVSTVGALVAIPGPAQAAARPTWASSGLTGVQASGSYSRSGNTVHFYGRLYDTAADNESVVLWVNFSGDPYTHTVTNSNGSGTSVSIDMTSSVAAHLKVREEKYNRLVTSTGPWVTIF